MSTMIAAESIRSDAPMFALDRPFDPDRSLQLNNKYWPGARYTLLALLEDCEQAVVRHGAHQNGGPFKHLHRLFSDASYYELMMRRLGKLLCFKSNFGYKIERAPVEPELLALYGSLGDRDGFSINLPGNKGLDALSAKVRRLYHREYGWDISRIHKSVRHAKVDASSENVTKFGLMSDYHNDERKGITGIVYLTEVKKENGAFSLIRDSEKIPRSAVLTAIHQMVCFDMGLADPSQMDALPVEFRGTPLVGNFLEPEKVALLLKNEVVIEGPPGTAVVFNGQYVIHRGGKPLAGTRAAAFLAMEGLFIHKMRSLLSRFH